MTTTARFRASVAALVLLVCAASAAAHGASRNARAGLRFQRSGERERERERGAALANCGYPEAEFKVAQVAGGTMKAVDQNRAINEGYIKLARCFQSIVEGNPANDANLGKSVPPVWFVFAPYASRVVGKGLIALELAISAISQLIPETWTDVAWTAIKAAFNPSGTAVEAGIEAGRFVRKVFDAVSIGQNSGNMAALQDVNILSTTTQRAANLIASVNAHQLTAKARAFAQTLFNALKEGNRLIYSDIGGNAAKYIVWRRSLPAAPKSSDVLSQFATKAGANTANANKAFMFAVSEAIKGNVPFQFDQQLPGMTSLDYTVAAFALWEEASTKQGAGQTKQRDALIKIGNNLLAWREQHDAVQPAFTPNPDPKVGNEVKRVDLFQTMSATIHLLFRGGAKWTFYDYCKAKNIDILTQNWGLFKDRWAPIINSFDVAYANPGAVWPMPPADPSQD